MFCVVNSIYASVVCPQTLFVIVFSVLCSCLQIDVTRIPTIARVSRDCMAPYLNQLLQSGIGAKYKQQFGENAGPGSGKFAKIH